MSAQTVSDLLIVTSRAGWGEYETYISADSIGVISYGKGTEKEAEMNALNLLYEQRRLVLMALYSGLGQWLTMADICQRAELPTSVVQYQIKKLLECGRIIQNERGGSYKPSGD